MLFKIVFTLLLSIYSFALDEIYFLPYDNERVVEDISKILKEADNSIDIAMYNFTYKKFAKILKKASKKGVDVTIIYYKTKLKFYKKINLLQTKRKQHIKLAIIDDKFAIYGSANWKKESFRDNYEIINITDDKNKIKKFKEIFDRLQRDN